MGFRYFVGQKIDYQDYALRAAAKELEFSWRPDVVNKPNIDVVGHVMWDNLRGYSYTLPPVYDVRSTQVARRTHWRQPAAHPAQLAPSAATFPASHCLGCPDRIRPRRTTTSKRWRNN